MSEIIYDNENGTVKLTDSWLISATGSSASPQFSNIGDVFSYTFVDINNIDRLKSFTYSYTNGAENRYLTASYRISRNMNNWGDWLPLNTNITNFPPFTSTDTMYLDIKFERGGSSNTKTIQLIDYTINGVLDRQLADGLSTIVLNSSNNSVVVKPPFIYKVFKITDIEIISNGIVNTNFTIKYRFSQDYGRTVTNWEPLTKENITTVRITPIRFFQIEYLVELVGSTPVKIYDINLIGDFQNVTLDYKKSNLYGVRENCESIILCISNDSGIYTEDTPKPIEGSVLPQLSDSDASNLFKPYQLDAATELLDKMSNDANSIFGHEVYYFLTDPDKKGIDYTFHEYQLLNYVCDEPLKISVENNQFPENSGAINQFDLSLFDSFEVHITKEIFKKAFGVEKRPSKDDFLWFCQLNRMFSVEHAQPFRGFNNSAIYYKVMLKKYSQKANIIGGNQTISDKVKALTRNSTIDELFGLENEQDKLAVANKEQLRPLTHDILRVDINARINKELIENAQIIISKNNYDLSSVGFSATQSSDAVVYKNMKNYFKVSDNIGYICWFNINNYTLNDNYNLFNYYDSVNELGFKTIINSDEVKVTLNEDVYSLPLEDSLLEETWYAYVLNVDQRQRKISQYIYKRDIEDESEADSLNSTKLKLVYSNTIDMMPVEFKLENIKATLQSCDMKITNIRLFLDIISQNQHNKILNQSIIRDDSKYLIFADNANSKLVLPYMPLGQDTLKK
jgi:hypothetical protein